MADTKISRVFKKPVAWLLGRDLIASLQGTLLYTAFGSKLDPREWMTAREYSFDDEDGEKEFWFDYIADSGDGTKATYSIAYLSLSNLFVEKLLAEMPSGTDGTAVRRKPEGTFKAELPRGKFLLVGGDTSYHLADYATLGTRFYQPFRWAFDDLWKKLEEEKRTDELKDLKKRRPIFGIPGNHDYYDQLDGFRRQFRRPTKEEKEGSREENLPSKKDLDVPQLMLPGFKRLQKSSYVGLRLPFGWRLWGLDTEVGLIDEHQQNFFRKIKTGLYKEAVEEWENSPVNERGEKPELDDFPQKLILATCSPTTSFGRFAQAEDKKSAESIAQLKLPQPFMPDDGDETISERSGDAKLKVGQCRLDLSGDYHFYARYWGPQSAGEKPREKSDTEQPVAESYASVISGLGGAFHHPSQTYFGDLQEQVLYPSERISREFFAGPLFNFKSILKGGGVGIIGLLLAFAIYFTATVPQSSRLFLQNVFSAVHLADPVVIEPTVLPIVRTTPSPQTKPASFVLSAESFDSTTKRYYVGSNPLPMSWTQYVIMLILFASVGMIIFGSYRFSGMERRSLVKQVGKGKEIVLEKDPAKKPEPEKYKFFGSGTQLAYGFLVLASAALLFFGQRLLMPYRPNIMPFEHSMLVLLTFVWSVAAIVLSLLYSEWLFKQASVREIKRRDWALPWICSILGICSIAAGIWLFGKYNMPAYLITDIIFILATIGIGIVVVLLAGVVGGGDLKGKKGVVGMVFIGLWHAILQLTIPFFLVNKGNEWTFIIFALLVVIFGLIGWQLMKRNYRWVLLGVWLLFGALMITLPCLVLYYTEPNKEINSYLGCIGEWQRWFQGYIGGLQKQSPGALESFFLSVGNSLSVIAPSLIAGFIGLIMSCIWLGWYLAVSLSFNAHNNEAGGAGRIEEFKEFIRFRLTENEITGYVIAFDKPEEDGSWLKPRLIDVFTLKTKGS